jgi:hypothetical protein
MSPSKYACRRTTPKGRRYAVDLSASLDTDDALKEWADLSTELGRLLQDESPRGMGLIARAFTESMLEACLRKAQRDRMRQKPNYSKVIDGGLAQKIEVCLKDEVVPRSLRTKLCCIKEVGDAFAHNHRASTFMHPMVRPHMRRLQRSTVPFTTPFREHRGHPVLTFALQIIIASTGALRQNKLPLRLP